jgi:hypothetical protein
MTKDTQNRHEAFLKDLESLYVRHGLFLSHEDSQGAFQVIELDYGKSNILKGLLPNIREIGRSTDRYLRWLRASHNLIVGPARLAKPDSVTALPQPAEQQGVHVCPRHDSTLVSKDGCPDCDSEKQGGQEPSMVRFLECGGDQEHDPVEQLRFFCSIAMKPQDWLDVEKLFDGVIEARGFHWEHPVGGFMGFLPTEGFWTCSKYYDPVTKRRIGT